MRGFSFSWKRALGITAAKQRFARSTGIPTTKAGLERKIGGWVLSSLITSIVVSAYIAHKEKSMKKDYSSFISSDDPSSILSDNENKEDNENEKKKKWWYNLFISILHIFVPSSKKVLKKKR